MTEADVKQLIITIVAPLVADPEAIRIETKRDTRFLNFNLTVAKDDVGRVNTAELPKPCGPLFIVYAWMINPYGLG